MRGAPLNSTRAVPRWPADVLFAGRSAVGDPEAWWHFNDARVTKASPDEVAHAQAYILMYAKAQ